MQGSGEGDQLQVKRRGLLISKPSRDLRPTVELARVCAFDWDHVVKEASSRLQALQEAEALLGDGDACPPHLRKTQALEALEGYPVELAGVAFPLDQVLQGPLLRRAEALLRVLHPTLLTLFG
jgi:hypothetical protein